jgi:uncharacterized protein
MSGPREGRDAILAFFGEVMARSGETFTVTLLDDAVNVFHVSGGVVTEVGEFFEDTAESDAFWA